MRRGAGTAGNQIGRVIKQAIKKMEDREPLELGTIQADMSLKLDTFGIPIPKGEYLISRTLCLPDTIETDTAGEDSHKHNIQTPEQISRLKPDDRVLCAWVNRGKDIVVLETILRS